MAITTTHLTHLTRLTRLLRWICALALVLAAVAPALPAGATPAARGDGEPPAAPSVEEAGAPARSLVYVAIGASDTVGVGAADPATQGWVPQLHRKLPAGTALVNLGVSGSLMRDALAQQLPAAVAAQPDLVTIWLAVNDLNAQVPLEQYAAGLNSLLGELRSNTGARIAVANVPDLALVPTYRSVDPTALRAEVARWNVAIGEITAQHGAVLVDLYAFWPELAAHPEYISADGFHPSAAGYARLAEVFWDALMLQG